MNSILNVGLVGAGVAASKAVAALAGSADINFSGVYSKRIALPASSLKIPRIESYDKLLDMSDLHAVYIATPVNSHLTLAKTAVEAGLPVLIEKPFGLSYAAVQQFVDTHAGASLVCVAFKKRFGAAVNRIRQYIRSTDRIVEVACKWRIPPPLTIWRRERSVSGGGVVMDLGSHILDLFENLLGRIRRVTTVALGIDKEFCTENMAEIELVFESGCKGRILIDWESAKLSQELRISGLDNSIHLTRINQEEDCLQMERETPHWCQNYHPKDEYVGLFSELHSAIFSNKGHALPGLSAALRNHLLIDAVYLSSAEQRSVDIQ